MSIFTFSFGFHSLCSVPVVLDVCFVLREKKFDNARKGYVTSLKTCASVEASDGGWGGSNTWKVCPDSFTTAPLPSLSVQIPKHSTDFDVHKYFLC